MVWNILTTIVPLIALALSVKAWQKNRAIYGIERRVIRQVTGNHDDIHIDEQAAKLNQDLSSGSCTILAALDVSNFVTMGGDNIVIH